MNDTFTALTCIDWLGASMCKVTDRWHPVRVHRDGHGYVRVITAHISYTRMIERTFEKIRQAGRGMPAVLIRQLEAIRRIVDHTTTEHQRHLLLEQATMIVQASNESVPEPTDRARVQREHEEVLAALERAGSVNGAAEETPEHSSHSRGNTPNQPSGHNPSRSLPNSWVN